jgi:U3 small nucleolar RNA-associated protein 14
MAKTAVKKVAKKVATKKATKTVAKKATVKKQELSSYAKRYDALREELFSLMTDENSDICPTCAASTIILDAAVYGGHSFYESMGILAEAQEELREAFDGDKIH